MLKLRKPIVEGMDRNDWEKACELFVEKIKLAEQMLDSAHKYVSQTDIENWKRGVELYRETYSQVAAEALRRTSRWSAWIQHEGLAGFGAFAFTV